MFALFSIYHLHSIPLIIRTCAILTLQEEKLLFVYLDCKPKHDFTIHCNCGLACAHAMIIIITIVDQRLRGLRLTARLLGLGQSHSQRGTDLIARCERSPSSVKLNTWNARSSSKILGNELGEYIRFFVYVSVVLLEVFVLFAMWSSKRSLVMHKTQVRLDEISLNRVVAFLWLFNVFEYNARIYICIRSIWLRSICGNLSKRFLV